MKIETLKRPAQFKRARGRARWAGPLFIMEARQRQPSEPVDAGTEALGPRFGFTITRKIGNAVVRNRVRRRLKEALRTIGSGHARHDYDYVVVASRAAHDYPFAGLQDAFREAFERLHRQADSGQGRIGQGRRHTKGQRDSAPALADSTSNADPTPGPGDGQRSRPRADRSKSGNGRGRR
ncbi:MAG: ribonuclease P protein component [Hyphomicrobiaceae bacterium]